MIRWVSMNTSGTGGIPTLRVCSCPWQSTSSPHSSSPSSPRPSLFPPECWYQHSRSEQHSEDLLVKQCMSGSLMVWGRAYSLRSMSSTSVLFQVWWSDLVHHAWRIRNCRSSSIQWSSHPHHLHLCDRVRADWSDHALRPSPGGCPHQQCHRLLPPAQLLWQHHLDQEASLPSWHHAII